MIKKNKTTLKVETNKFRKRLYYCCIAARARAEQHATLQPTRDVAASDFITSARNQPEPKPQSLTHTLLPKRPCPASCFTSTRRVTRHRGIADDGVIIRREVHNNVVLGHCNQRASCREQFHNVSTSGQANRV
jgi:hypothetical protein